MEHSEEIAQMEADVHAIKCSIEHLYDKYSFEAITYALFESVVCGFDYDDVGEMNRHHSFAVECLHECINKSVARN